MIYEMLKESLGALGGRLRALESALNTLIASGVAVPPPVTAFLAGDIANVDANANLMVPTTGIVSAIPTAQSAFTTTATHLAAEGTAFQAAFPPTPADSVEIDNVRAAFDDLDDYITQAVGELEQITSPLGPSLSAADISNSVEDIASYPLLTSGVASLPSTGGGGGAGTMGVVLQRTVDVALKQTLGRLPKFTDAKAFVAALDSSFTIRQEAGRSVVAWQPRSYVGQTELGGGVTGAQASVYARARNALSVALPLIDGLYPLLPDPDPQEMEAARSIVKTQFQTLVDEIGVEGGPRVQRVDELFEVLLDQSVTGVSGVPIPGGMVGYLAEVFGLKPQQVNTIDEEQDLSNFLLVRDYLAELKAAWITFSTGTLGRDLGTRLVLLSKALQVVAESVDEVYAAMDSVFVGDAERGVAAFQTGLPVPADSMLVSDLLSWIASFATDEAPVLVQEGGRRGVSAIIGTAHKLENMTAKLVAELPADPSLPDGLRHPRVRNPLDELRTYLRRVAQLAEEVRKP